MKRTMSPAGSRALLLVSFVLLTGCTSIRCVTPLAGDAPPKYRWGCAKRVCAPTAGARDISITNQADGALSVLFTNGGVTLQPPMSKLTGRWTTYLELPVTSTATAPQRLRCQVRGAIVKPANTHASALIDVGGGSIALDFATEAERNEPISGEVEFATPIGNGAMFPISVLATVTRSSPDDIVALSLDSIDCTMIQATP